MRLTGEIEKINYEETEKFFEKRANKFREDNPYSVTMYQDDNKELVDKRNYEEVQRLMPLLNVNQFSKVLDIGCGIGRWADALPDDISKYCGIDFSSELINIANSRNKRSNFTFLKGSTNEIEKVLFQENNAIGYNIVLLMGILIYLNDSDVFSLLEQVERISEQHAIVCIREPIGIEERLTLKDFFSEELKDNYNAIYRTREELGQYLDATLLKKGFQIKSHGFLFSEDSLNNRKETTQYYYVLER